MLLLPPDSASNTFPCETKPNETIITYSVHNFNQLKFEKGGPVLISTPVVCNMYNQVLIIQDTGFSLFLSWTAGWKVIGTGFIKSIFTTCLDEPIIMLSSVLPIWNHINHVRSNKKVP